MKLSNLLIPLVAAVVAFAVGRYTATPLPKTEVTKIEKDKEKEKDTHKTTVIVKEPGTGKETTTIVEDTKTRTEEHTDQLTKVATTSRKAYNLSVLAKSQLRTITPVYGLSASTEVLGPITVGGFGYTDGTFGLSLGVNF